MAEEYYDKHFPQLRKEGFRRTSDPAYYNCIAYAAGDERRRWWPGEYDPNWSDDYWPAGVPNEATVGAFVQALATVGYEPCADGSWEDGFEKVALYALASGEVRHAARQRPGGTWWRSKLGADEDIDHTLTGLEGPLYGTVVRFLRRRVQAGASGMKQ
jgi:hypothetical protein